MPRLTSFDRPRPWYWCEPGLYAVSATMLQHVYMPGQAQWNMTLEKSYQQLRLNDNRFRELQTHHEKSAELMGDITPDQWSTAWAFYEQLRFARLCTYLRARPPDAMAGYSILIYRLSRKELTAVLDGDTRILAAAIEQATVPSRR
jgi:hypothetical protein